MKALLVFISTALATAAWCEKPCAQPLQGLYETGSIVLVEDQVFGSEYEEEESALFHATSVCVDDEGQVYVLDYKMYCVKKFGPGGELLRTFSRKGEGPGELGRAYRMAITPQGRLVVFDADNHRFTVFDRSGDYVDARAFQGWVTGLHVLPDGSLILRYSIMTEDWMKRGSLYRVSRLAPDLVAETVIDSAFIQESEIVQATGTSMTTVGKPFIGQFHVAVSPAGNILTALGDEYRVKILTPSLEPIHEITRAVARVGVTKADKEEYFQFFKDSDENFQIMVRQKVQFPKHKPYISALFTDHNGYILVEVPESTGSDDTMYYDVFSPGGRFVNRVEMTTLRTPVVFRNGFLYMGMSSGDELPVVIRYRLQAVANDDTSEP